MFFCQLFSESLSSYLRPETAQGHFVNFQRLYEYNYSALPFASAQIGRSFRNEISPRNGLLRVREFTMAEIEHFVDPTDKSHPRFKEVANTKMCFLRKEVQSAGKNDILETTIGEAVSSKMVANEVLGYFLARIFLFLVKIGHGDPLADVARAVAVKRALGVRDPGLVDGIEERRLADALAVIAEVEALPPEHPDAVALRLAVGGVFKTLKETRRKERQARITAHDAAVTAATATGAPGRIDDETEGAFALSTPTTTELADILQRDADVPFRVGHHFASDLVTYGRSNGLRPTQIPFSTAQDIYAKAAAHFSLKETKLPLSEADFRRALTAENMVRSSLGIGGPQPAEVQRMLTAQRTQLAADQTGIAERQARLAQAAQALDKAFTQLREGR